MMGILDSIFLAILQGLTEFLPVSSSGHLVFLEQILNLPSESLTFKIILHLGTLIATILYFRKEIRSILIDSVRELSNKTGGKNTRLLLQIVIANIPIAVVGILFRDSIEVIFKEPVITGAMFIVTGSFLLMTKFLNQGEKEYSLYELPYFAIVGIGVFQAAALLPGVSRSGITISVAMFLAVSNEDAGTFSFLLSIPAIAGAFVLEFIQAEQAMNLLSTVNVIGLLVSTLTGYLALRILMPLLRKNLFYLFAFYLFPLGGAGILLFSS